MAAMAEAIYLESKIDQTWKRELIAAGASDSYADCVVSMLNTFGYSDDLVNFSEYMLVEELETTEAQYAYFFCSKGGYPFLYFLVTVFLTIVGWGCCCCCLLCRFREKPVDRQITRTTMSLDQTLRQERMNQVWKMAVKVNVTDEKKKSFPKLCPEELNEKCE